MYYLDKIIELTKLCQQQFSPLYFLHWWVGGTPCKCKKVTYAGYLGQVVDAVDTVNIGGGDIVFRAKRSYPHSMQ